MRIISGELKGKTISFLKTSITRPLKDSVKENIFNILHHSNLVNIDLINSNVLDVYSGIGSFGLECISRGSKRVTFVEKDKNALEMLDKNLISLKIKQKSFVATKEIEFFLDGELLEKYEILFLDPPFSDNSYLNILKSIKKKNIYTKNHIVIIHREKKSLDDYSGILNPIIVKIYGRSKIIFGNF